MKKFTTTLALVVAMLFSLSLTAYADDQKAYADYDVTTDANKTKSGDDLTALQVKFNEKSWYIIEDNSTAVDAGTVTLLAAGTDFGNCKFSNDDTKSYNASIVKGIVDDLTENGAFKDVADAIKPCSLTTYEYRSETVAETTENAKLYLLSTEEAKKLSVDVLKMGKEEDMIYWWLRSPGNEDFFQQELFAAMVYGDYGFVYDGGFSVSNELLVRPALQLDLSKVTFDAENKTFTVGSEQAEGAPALGAAVTFSGEQWNVIGYNGTGVATATGTVTLLRASSYDANSTFDDNRSNVYSSSTLRGVIDGHLSDFTTEEQSAIITRTLAGGGYAGDDNSDYVSGASVDAKLWPLSAKEATELIANSYSISLSGYWWLRSPGSHETEVECIGDGSIFDYMAVDIPLGVRPALQIDLTKIAFDAETNTFSATAATSVATPTFTPAEGEYTSSQSVTISTTTEGARIYFTVDGTEPTTSSQLYNALMPIDLPAENGTYTIKAIAVKDGMANSEIASATYIINNATGIDETDADAVKSDIWYDLNGRCFQGKPTMPGVYINNGEKIIVQ